MDRDRSRMMAPAGQDWSVARRGEMQDPFALLQREVNRLFEEAFRGFGMPPLRGAGGERFGLMAPSIDVSETERELKLCAELPGLSEKDVEVTLEDDLLVLRGEKRSERNEEQESYHFTERSFGTFSRAVRLPFSADPEKVSAEFNNGVLTVRIAKPEGSAGRSRRIEIGRGAGASGGQRGEQKGEQRQTAKTGKPGR